MRGVWLSSLILMVWASAANAQVANTGTLVPNRDTSAMVDGLSPARKEEKGPSVSKAQVRQINDARATMRSYSTCLLATLTRATEHVTLVAFLKLPPQSDEALKLFKKLTRPDCLPLSGADYVQVTATSDLVRGGLMRALYLDTRRVPVRYRVTPEEITVVPPSGDATFDLLQRFGTCIAKKQRGDAERFVITTPGSTEEAATVRALGPTLNACLEKGLNMHFSYGVLEGVLAEALFKQTGAAPAVTASKVAS